MDSKLKIHIVMGTRPEAIKLAPLAAAMRAHPQIECKVIATGQHEEMLYQALQDFDCPIDVKFEIPRDGRTLAGVTCEVIQSINGYIKDDRPDWIISQGDTTTAFASGLVGFYEKIKVGHVEAGLRSGNIHHPFPEEVNRKLIGQFATLHFAPTQLAYANLIREDVAYEQVHQTGNTVVDALHFIENKINTTPEIKDSMNEKFSFVNFDKKVILFTSHRRENLGENQIQICQAVKEIAAQNTDSEIVFPMHLNPAVRNVVIEQLEGIDNIHLVEPFSYLEMIYILSRVYLVVTDSGGLQEEAPSFGKPVLVLRETSERMEAVYAGTAKLLGSDKDLIIKEANTLLQDEAAYKAMSEVDNPFGDGTTCQQIIDLILNDTQTFD